MSVTRESHRDRMQVLVDGQWVDVGGVQTLDGFTVGDPIIDEAVVEPLPTSFSMTMQFDAEQGAAFARSFRDLVERAEREARAERARRRLWLRYPYRMPR